MLLVYMLSYVKASDTLCIIIWIRLCTYYYVIIIRLLFVMLIIGIKIYVFQSHDSLTYRFLYLKLGATRTDWVVSACP